MPKRKQAEVETGASITGCEDTPKRRKRKPSVEEGRQLDIEITGSDNRHSEGTGRTRRRRKSGNLNEDVVDPVPTNPAPGKTARRRSRIEIQPVQEHSDCEDTLPEGPCCDFCGQCARRGLRLRAVSLNLQVDDRVVKMKTKQLCEECIVHLPDYISGSLHLGLSIPKEKFTRKFLLPPLEVCLEREVPEGGKRTRRKKV